MSKLIHIAIDGNEANVVNRVGSNVYAFAVLHQLWALTKNPRKFHCTILLAHAPVEDFPPERKNWQYQVIGPARFWTQWALPLPLFWRRGNYDVFFTTSHYAPRVSAVPYVSSVMDTAYLDFPDQFRRNDLYQLTHWTHYSVKRAAKVITISQFSKQHIHAAYHKPLADIVVAPPAVSLPEVTSPLRVKAFWRKHKIEKGSYFLYVGTLQPRKNLENLIEAFEIFSRSLAAHQLKKRVAQAKQQDVSPQLVLAGKVGWLAKGIQDRIEASPLKNRIITTGFISDELKRALYQQARATVLVSLSEGFGIPSLESISVGTIPIVSNTSSLPEVVGQAGLLVDPTQPHQIAQALKKVWHLSASQQQQFAKKAQKQLAQFTWQKTGKTILNTLMKVARHAKKT